MILTPPVCAQLTRKIVLSGYLRPGRVISNVWKTIFIIGYLSRRQVRLSRFGSRRLYNTQGSIDRPELTLYNFVRTYSYAMRFPRNIRWFENKNLKSIGNMTLVRIDDDQSKISQNKIMFDKFQIKSLTFVERHACSQNQFLYGIVK